MTVLNLAQMKADTTHVTVHGPQGPYEKVERFPIADIRSNKVFLAYEVNGEKNCLKSTDFHCASLPKITTAPIGLNMSTRLKPLRWRLKIKKWSSGVLEWWSIGKNLK